MATMVAISVNAQDGNNPTQGQAMTETIDEGTKYPEIIALDSIYNAPVLISWFDKPVAINLENNNKLAINVAEITDLYSGDKKYRLHFDINFSSIDANAINFRIIDFSIKQFVSYEKGVSMVNALKGIHKYIAEQLPSTPENIRYSIDLSSDVIFDMHLSYNPENYKWICCMEFSTPNSKLTYSTKYRTASNGFTIYGYLKNFTTDFPRLINTLETQLMTLKTKMEQTNVDSLDITHQNDGTVICQYNYTEFPSGELNVNIEDIYDLTGYASKLNSKLNKILHKEIPSVENFGKYGLVNIVVGKKGKVLGYKLILKEEAFNLLNKRTIMIMLNCIGKATKLSSVNPPLSKTHDNIVAIIPLTDK